MPLHGMKALEERKMASTTTQQNHMASNTTKLRGYLQVKHNPATRRSRLPRKVRMDFVAKNLGWFMYWKIFLAPSFEAARALPIFLMKAKVRCNFRQATRQSSAYSSYPPRLNFNQMVEYISSCLRCSKCIFSLQTNEEVHLMISLFDLRRASKSINALQILVVTP